MKPFAYFGMIVLLGISATAGATTPEAQVMAPVRLFIDSFNKGDMKAAATTLAPAGVTIIDDVSPHEWSGPTALEAWGKALAASELAAGHSDGTVALGKPTRVIIDAEHAYVVAPVVYTFKAKGVAMREPAQMVETLQKGASGWQITGWAWAGTKPKPADGAAR